MEQPRGQEVKGMEGLLTEGSELMKEDAEPEVIDAGMISAAQRVEHYEIAAYGTVRTYAELLGLKKAANLLQETLDEEKATDQKLSGLARQSTSPLNSPQRNKHLQYCQPLRLNATRREGEANHPHPRSLSPVASRSLAIT